MKKAVSYLSVALIPVCIIMAACLNRGASTDGSSAKVPRLVLEQSNAGHLIAVSPNGKIIASAEENRIVLIDAETGEILHEIRKFEIAATVYGLAFSPDGQTLAFSGCGRTHPYDSGICEEGRVVIMGLDDGKVIHEFKENTFFTTVAFSPDGASLAAFNYGKIILYDTKAGKIIHSMITPEDEKASGLWDGLAAFSPKGDFIASSGCMRYEQKDPEEECGDSPEEYKDMCLREVEYPDCEEQGINVWDAKTGTIAKRIRFEIDTDRSSIDGNVHSTAISPDGKLLVIGTTFFLDHNTETGEFQIFDMETGGLSKKFRVPTDAIGRIVFPVKENLFVSGAAEDPYLPDKKNPELASKLYLWDASEGKQLKDFEVPYTQIFDIAAGPGGNVFVTGEGNGSVTTVRIPDGEKRILPSGSAYSTGNLAISKDGTMLAAGSDMFTEIWSLADTTKRTAVFTAGEYMPIVDYSDVFFTPAGDDLFLVQKKGLIRSIDPDSGAVTNSYDIGDIAGAAGISSDGKTIFIGSGALSNKKSGAEVDAYDRKTLNKTASVTIPEEYVVALEASPSGSYLALSSHSFGYDEETVKQSIEENNFHLFKGEEKTAARLLDTQTLELVATASTDLKGWIYISFSPDGKNLALAGCAKEEPGLAYSSCSLGGLEIFEIPDMRLVSRRTIASDGLDAVAFSPDGMLIATAGKSLKDGAGRIYVWAAGEGDKPKTVFKGHLGLVSSLVFSKDSKFLFSNNINGSSSNISIWRISNGELLAKLVSFTDGNWFVIAEDGRFDCSGCNLAGEKTGGKKYIRWLKENRRAQDDSLFNKYLSIGLLGQLLQ